MVGRDSERWRLGKAERFLRAADRAFDSEDWETAVSRAYYAVYHAVIALLEARAGIVRRRWDHVQVQNDFRTHFTRRGYLFTVRQAGHFEELLEARLVADYEAERLRRGRAAELLRNAYALYERLLEEVKDA